MITKEKKTDVITANATHENDTGSPEVQVAIWTERIRELTEHLKAHPNDDHSRLGIVWACTSSSVSAAACSTTSPRRTSSAIVHSSQS